jgi:tRNA-specific 2-thiouridylase
MLHDADGSDTKTLVAMSGGVDSSVAAWLLKNSGCDCAGAMMKLLYDDYATTAPTRACCTLADSEDARSVAYRIDIPFYMFNFTADFEAQVVEPFIDAYRNGLTPNPCIDCNRRLKFERFLVRALELGFPRIATGHYARITRDGGRYLLKRASDAGKDQSYVLYSMTQEQLARTVFPLGEMTKREVREIALDQGFINAGKRDSQDICFVPDGDYAAFVESRGEPPDSEGRFADADGNDLGRHGGIHRYTVGQRKGLRLSHPRSTPRTPMYVLAIDPTTNTVTVGAESGLYTKSLIAHDINLIPFDGLEAPMRVTARIRYRQGEQPAVVSQPDRDTLRVDFDSPQRAVTKGQAVVLYDGDTVVGGGTIAG